MQTFITNYKYLLDNWGITYRRPFYKVQKAFWYFMPVSALLPSINEQAAVKKCHDFVFGKKKKKKNKLCIKTNLCTCKYSRTNFKKIKYKICTSCHIKKLVQLKY